MTLDFSRRPIFPLNQTEEILASSVKNANGYFFEGKIPERNCDCGTERNDKEGSWEPVSDDIIDLLPLDPFDMGIAATFAAMASWVDGYETDILSVFCKKEVKFWAEPGNVCIYERSNPFDGFETCGKQYENDLGNGGLVLNRSTEEFLTNEDSFLASPRESETVSVSCSDGYGREPHEGLAFSLRYLGIQDLLSMESVCRSLRYAVRNDVLPWRSIHINHPLNERITDDALLQLTNKAQGHLQSLSLVDCLKITDDGLKCVLDRNPRLTKLNVSGCARLSVDGIVNNLKAFKSSTTLGIKQLRVGERFGITQKHFKELKSLIGAEECNHPKAPPCFYHNGHSSFSCGDDRAIDIEMCPRCQKVKLVYDCPAESCQGKQSVKQPCRACIICIPRCFECGRCINDIEYEETFCLDLLCANC